MLIEILVMYSHVVSRGEARSTFRAAANIVARDTGVRFVPRFERVRVSGVSQWNLLQQYSEVFGEERSFLLVRQSKNGLVQGMARICGDRGVGVLWGRGSSVTVAHELGHMLGAIHEDGNSIMNPSPGLLADSRPRFSVDAVNAITECLGR